MKTPKKMKILVIDDESSARKVLELSILEVYSDVEIIYEATNLQEGVELIKEKKPNIVFLDIEMPGKSGLQIFDLLDSTKFSFQLIFVTAYDQYAIRAFKLSAIDYILKPISKIDLKRALQKALNNISSNSMDYQFSNLKKVLQQFSNNKIAFEVPKGISFLSLDDVYYFEADEMYTNIFLANKKSQVICKPLKHFHEQLNSNPFFYRCHRSYIINLKHLKELKKKDGFYVILDNDSTVPIAKSKYDDFLKVVNETF